ncbi:15-hydroxyprostaglandin dehydrogenase [NAD(+)]-like isoform X1 [Adelges cooleyi]|uniref:15-hydroxyprostaglandin dehydrogenase [NAD(+)]-like isoform X1 n=1 Tax=Adelges cooleyi TaxID=133065 RepID=UPI00218024B8|nr:15-hydroxyprostaglandin dehydrogenase [NAD(+)]-like isoform X1 [Adelges cooleyi]
MERVNQVALVTGAASGIGYAYTKYLLQNNVKVALCDINIKQCQSVSNEFAQIYGRDKVLALHCDVTSDVVFESAFKLCIDHFKRLDIVVNNAGIFNETMEKWESTINVNYGGVVRGTMLAIKYMGRPYGGNGGTVVQTASIAAFMGNLTICPIYRSTKRAVVEFTRAIGDKKTFEHLNVRIMVLCPGYVQTPFIEGDRSSLYLIKEYGKKAKDTMATYPVQSPESVAKGLIEILKHGITGDCWIVENDAKPRPANLPDIPY